MAILGQNQSTFARYIVWIGNCSETKENIFDLTLTDKIQSVFEFTQNGSGTKSYYATISSIFWDFSELKPGHAYFIVMKQGTGHVEIPNATLSYFEKTDKNYLTSECESINTPTPIPEVEECCSEFSNKIKITQEMAREIDTIPFTKNGFSVSGFEEGATICFDDLNVSKDKESIYVISDADFRIGGMITTDYEIVNNNIKYTSINGDCYQAKLEDNPLLGYNELALVDDDASFAPDETPDDNLDLTNSSPILVRRLFTTQETLVTNDDQISELKKGDIVRIQEDNQENCWELIKESTNTLEPHHSKIVSLCTDEFTEST